MLTHNLRKPWAWKKNCRSNVFGIRKKPIITGETELETAVVMSLQFFGLFVFPEFLLQLYTINLFEWNKKVYSFLSLRGNLLCMWANLMVLRHNPVYSLSTLLANANVKCSYAHRDGKMFALLDSIYLINCYGSWKKCSIYFVTWCITLLIFWLTDDRKLRSICYWSCW